MSTHGAAAYDTRHGSITSCHAGWCCAHAGDMYRVRLNYFEPLDFQQGSYLVTLPTTIPPSALAPGVSASQALKLQVTIHTGQPVPVKPLVTSGHIVAMGSSSPGTQELAVAPGAPLPAGDFVGGYSVWGNDMFVSLNVNPPGTPGGSPAYDPRGTFVLTAAPPAPEFTQPQARSLVFLLDRSGSMGRRAMDAAKAAVCWALNSLTASDEFAVAAFDHETVWFSQELVAGTPENTQAAAAWIAGNVEARGMTDIMGPVYTAFNMLSRARGLPFIFLITGEVLCSCLLLLLQGQCCVHAACKRQGGVQM